MRFDVDDYDIHCLFKVIFNLAAFIQAHEAVCEYVKVPCVHSDCGELVTRAQLADHLKQRCQYRLDTCEYCHTQVIFCSYKGMYSDN